MKKMKKMKKIIFTLLLFQVGVSFAQSKKEQIEILNLRKDSLNNVLENERKINIVTVQECKSAIDMAQNQISLLRAEVKKGNDNFDQIKQENVQLKSNLGAQLNEINDLKLQLKNKSDVIASIEGMKGVDSKIGEEKELIVKFTNIIFGDMSPYIDFEPVNSDAGLQDLGFDTENLKGFAYWTWEPGPGSIEKEMEDFDETEYGTLYKIKIKYSVVKDLEYQGFEIGNVETGLFHCTWVLTKIEAVQ
jgi:hypothetical protein